MALLVLPALLLAACGNSTSAATEWTFGDSLAIRTKETRFVSEVRYSICYPIGDPKCTPTHYLIKPSQEDRAILAAHIEVFNRQANVAYLTINKHSLTLKDQNYFEYLPIDPFVERTEVPTAGSGENTLAPFIWADGSEIAPPINMPAKCGELNQNCQLVGWVLFEVPETIKPTQLVWESADTVYMYFDA
ncbi:MAG: hypothetical protein HY681_09445 [Chloroflexi bacterium]|nr:hypothetical protein [Chloroflexota bacterium]